MIVVDKLVFEYPGKRALQGVSFTIETGSITALVGPNGAGKSTLLRCISGLDEALSGDIMIDGIDVAQEPRLAHRMLGYLSDAFGVYEDLTVEKCLSYAAGLHSMRGRANDEAIAQVVELLELAPYRKQTAATLSRGWRQRLGIAQALIHRPPLVLLDEPASGLDPEARIELSSLFKNMQAQGMTLVVSSHILAELEDYCTDMIVLRDGSLVDQRAQTRLPVDRVLHLRTSGEVERALAILQAQPQISSPNAGASGITARYSGDEAEQSRLLYELVSQGVPVLEFSVQRERLQDVYLSMRASS